VSPRRQHVGRCRRTSVEGRDSGSCGGSAVAQRQLGKVNHQVCPHSWASALRYASRCWRSAGSVARRFELRQRLQSVAAGDLAGILQRAGQLELRLQPVHQRLRDLDLRTWRRRGGQTTWSTSVT
jgi:hypothetical protein